MTHERGRKQRWPRRVVVAAPAFTRAVVHAIRVGLTMAPDVVVVHVTADLAEGDQFRDRAVHQVPGTRVVIVESPYRSLVNPFIRYLETSQSEHPDEVTVNEAFALAHRMHLGSTFKALLNGEPVEVSTTIDVNFTLSQ